MKVAAHPLVVAVALGLLAPQALEAQDSVDNSEHPCTDCPDAMPSATTVPAYEPGEAPSAEDFHRVEIEWLKATGQNTSIL